MKQGLGFRDKGLGFREVESCISSKAFKMAVLLGSAVLVQMKRGCLI